jgi:hypothetical protein
MKSSHCKKGSVLIIAISLLLFSGCSKKFYDYRIKYTGNYRFATIMSSTPIIQPSSESIYYNGKIELADDDSLLIIRFLNGFRQEYKILEDGTLWPSLPNGSYPGEFINSNSVYFKFYIQDMSGTTYFHVEGNRIN